VAGTAGRCDLGEEPVRHLVGAHAFGLRPEVDENAVAEDRRRYMPDVLERDRESPSQECARLAAEDQRLARARSRTPAHEFAHHRHVALGRARRADQPRHVVEDRIGQPNLAHERLRRQDVGTAQDGRRSRLGDAGRPRQNGPLFVLGGIADPDVQQESIELGFRQRVRAGLLDRILGREHEEGEVELVRRAPIRHRMLLHRLEQRRLRLGRRPVDLVGEHDIREDGAAREREEPPTCRMILLEHFGAEDVARHEVGSELDTPEREVDGVGECADEQRLRESGHAFEQRMAAGEKRRQQLVDRGLLPDDHPANLEPEIAQATEQYGDLAVRRRKRHDVIACTTMFTPNLVLSSARKRLLRKS
jgi:hypothetical protein